MKNVGIEEFPFFPEKGFPSPCGEMGMKNLKWILISEIMGFSQKNVVSVPLRGNGYEKLYEVFGENIRRLSFRPLAGKWV